MRGYNCKCEVDDHCTKTTMCAVETYVEDATYQLQAVVDAAVLYIHGIEEGHHGPLPAGTIRRRLKNLHEEVAAFDEWEQDV
jgi:hypothetical protein